MRLLVRLVALLVSELAVFVDWWIIYNACYLLDKPLRWWLQGIQSTFSVALAALLLVGCFVETATTD